MEAFSNFESLVAAFVELTTGAAERPILIYASTTGFLIAVGMIGSAAYGTLKLYKLLLDIIAQHLSIKKTARDLAELQPESAVDLSKMADAALETRVEKAISSVLQNVEIRVTDERTHELKNTVRRSTIALVVPISQGGRISVSVECLDRMTLVTDGLSEDQVQGFKEDMAEVAKLETRVDVSLQQLKSAPLSKLGVELP